MPGAGQPASPHLSDEENSSGGCSQACRYHPSARAGLHLKTDEFFHGVGTESLPCCCHPPGRPKSSPRGHSVDGAARQWVGLPSGEFRISLHAMTSFNSRVCPFPSYLRSAPQSPLPHLCLVHSRGHGHATLRQNPPKPTARSPLFSLNALDLESG